MLSKAERHAVADMLAQMRRDSAPDYDTVFCLAEEYNALVRQLRDLRDEHSKLQETFELYRTTIQQVY